MQTPIGVSTTLNMTKLTLPDDHHLARIPLPAVRE